MKIQLFVLLLVLVCVKAFALHRTVGRGIESLHLHRTGSDFVDIMGTNKRQSRSTSSNTPSVRSRSSTRDSDSKMPLAAVSAQASAVALSKEDANANLMHKAKTAFYVISWWFLSAQYTTYNKLAMKLVTDSTMTSCPAAVTIAIAQLGMGFLVFLPLWALGLRERPANDFKGFKEEAKALSSVGLFQALTHVAGVIAMGAGAVSFSQIVKASEPAFTALCSAVFFKQFLPWQAYAALIPVIAGVIISSVKTLDFTWYCFYAVTTANIFAAMRGVFSKKKMTSAPAKGAKKLSAENLYAMLTILSFFFLLPVLAIMEPKGVGIVLGNQECLKNTLISGILFYLYNEFSFKALSSFTGPSAPVSHALSNTMKRVVILLAAAFGPLGETLTQEGKIGAAMSIGGVGLYSLMTIWYGKK